MDELRAFVAHALRLLPADEDSDVTLTADTTGPPPTELAAPSLLLKAMFPGHIYHPATRYDSVWFFADKETYRALGLLVLATIFHRSTTRLELSTVGDHMPGATILQLVIDSSADLFPAPGLLAVPMAFDYRPQARDHPHPLRHERYGGPRDTDLPTITWSNADEMLIREADWETRDVVHGFGEPIGASYVAALLLDIGLPATELREFNLEGPAGYQSVSALSSEARFWVGYDFDGAPTLDQIVR